MTPFSAATSFGFVETFREQTMPMCEPATGTLVDDGPVVHYTVSSAATVPIPYAGTIQDGTYELSAVTEYTSVSTTPPSTTASMVMTIAGNTMQQAGMIDGQEKRYTTTFAVSATATITTTDTCPTPSTSTHHYMATATELKIDDIQGAILLEQTYRKR